MLSVVSRWRWQGTARAERVRLAAGDGGAAVLDSKGKITFLDAAGAATWTAGVEDSVRDLGVPARGKEAFALSVREIVRFGATGKAVWRVPPPPFPVRMAVRRDGEVIAVSAGQGLVRLFETAGGRDIGGQRLTHAADHLALLAVEIVDSPLVGPSASRPSQTLTVVVSERGNVTLLDHLGNPHWTVALGAVAGPPDAAHDKVVVPSFDGVHAWLLDGTPAGLYEIGVPAAPAVRALLDDSAERLLVLDAKQRLFLLATKSGETLWHVQLPGEVADVSFAPDGSGIALAMRSGGVERLQVIDTSVAARASLAPPASGTFPAAAAISPGDSGGFLEMGEGKKFQPKPRWRVPISARVPRISLLRSGAGVVLLDVDEGVVSLWTGAPTPAWRAGGLGGGTQLAASASGDPIVVAGPAGIRFFSFEGGPIGAASVDARLVAVAESGGAVLAGSATSRLHLFDGAGRPVWDVPTPGFRAIGVSPGGSELAIVRTDGVVVFQVRGRTGGWTQDLGGTGNLEADEKAPVSRAVHIRVLEEGVVFANASGRAGFIDVDGRARFEVRLPGSRGAAELLPVAGDLLLRDDRGAWSRIARAPWALVPLPKAGDRGGNAASRFAFAMDHLVEIRYDSKEIASIDAVSGAVLWRRALMEVPKAVAVAADGSCLAAVVSGELVLYDLIGEESAPTSGPETQRFLEL